MSFRKIDMVFVAFFSLTKTVPFFQQFVFRRQIGMFPGMMFFLNIYVFSSKNRFGCLQLSGQMWFPAKITWIPGCFPFSTNSYGSFCIIAARWAETFSAWRMMSWNLCRRGVFASPDELGWLSHQFSNISQWTMVGAMQLQSDFPNHITHGFYGVFFCIVRSM